MASASATTFRYSWPQSSTSSVSPPARSGDLLSADRRLRQAAFRRARNETGGGLGCPQGWGQTNGSSAVGLLLGYARKAFRGHLVLVPVCMADSFRAL